MMTLTVPRRPDIQGLRAIAAILVLAFHAGVPGFGWGYLGVDLFFLISGFLISGNLMREIKATGKINILEFWIRRARRLLPASLLVIAVTVVAWLVLFPSRYTLTTVADAKRCLLYVGNFWFLAQQHDYFNSRLDPSPLLHFWSLGVEEQFYLAWPLLILGTVAAGWSSRTMIVGVVVASGAIGLYLAIYHPAAAFYLPFGRAWEFGVGAILALSGWPAKYNANRLLGRSWFQWVGDRSYSIYLWHWPLLLIANRFGGGGAARSAAVIGCLVLAALTFRFIEAPFRARSVRPLRDLVGYAAATVIILSGVAFVPLLVSYKNPYARESAQLQRHRGVVYESGCHVTAGTAQPECAFGDITSGRRAVLFGDSHAAQWFPAIENAAIKNGWRINSWTKASCPPMDLPIFNPTYKARDLDCETWRAGRLAVLKNNPPLVVILSSYSGYRHGWIFDPAARAVRAQVSLQQIADAKIAFIERLKSYGVTTIITVRDVPELSKDYLDCLASGGRCFVSKTDVLSRTASDLLAARATGTTLIDLTDDLCPDQKCGPIIDGQLAYLDENHLTPRIVTKFTHSFEVVLPAIR